MHHTDRAHHAMIRQYRNSIDNIDHLLSNEQRRSTARLSVRFLQRYRAAVFNALIDYQLRSYRHG